MLTKTENSDKMAHTLKKKELELEEQELKNKISIYKQRIRQTSFDLE